jgi:hypothetical protein
MASMIARWSAALDPCASFLFSVIDGFARARQRRALMALDDHLLKDIGISRADAVREWRKAPWRR